VSLPEILQNLDKRVGALESEGIEDSATITQIKKIYADVEVEVTWTYWRHKYRKCGDTQPLYGAVCGADTYL
jgi:hypothetical protein